MDIQGFIQGMPKVELHAHLFGSIPADTMARICKRNGIKPWDVGVKLYEFTDSRGFFSLSDRIGHSMNTVQDFEEATYFSLAESAKTSRTRFREISFAPQTLLHLSYMEALEGIMLGAKAAQQDFGIASQVIPCIHRKLGPQSAVDLVALISENPNELVMGIGMVGDERTVSNGAFREAYTLARNRGLRRTAHAGETGSLENVIASMEDLDCERIDHGYAVVTDGEAIANALDKGVHFTACWWTNANLYAAGETSLPESVSLIHRMTQVGLSVSVNTDNSSIFSTDLNKEFLRISEECRFTAIDITKMALGGIEGSWLEQGAKDGLKRELEEYVAQAKEDAIGTADVPSQH